MSQDEIDSAVAQATGESLRTIRRRGFSIVTPLKLFDPDGDCNAEPQVVDWDAVQAQRVRSAA
jgi:hypothetical protein